MTNIGDLLIDAGLSREKLDECRKIAGTTGDTLDRVILQKDYLPEPELLQVYASALGFEFREDLEGVAVPTTFVNNVPVHFARNYNLIALEQKDGETVKVATCTPLDPHPMDDLGALMGCEIDAVLAPRLEITTLIGRAYRHKADGVDEALADVAEDGDIAGLAEEIDEAEDVLDVSNKAPIIKLVNTILFQALKLRASDVHFQAYPDRLQVRFRIDGILYDMDSIPRRVQEAIVSRVKIMGRMDIAERRLPQDGRATIKIGDGEVDVRISSIPTTGGERIVMRLLDKSSKRYSLAEIGLSAANEEILREYINYTHGIILVTGPTGSGKTTTLYASLNQLDTTTKNVLTIEDPVEYSLAGVSQVQVNNKKGLTFASGLRSFLRQDPDVMMVGEIRDQETGEVAIRAALTGHLVFSTVHTNDAASTITRMVDQGIEPYDEKNRGWIDILMKMVSWMSIGGPQGTAPSAQTKQMFFMVSTDPDGFRDFVLNTKFLDTYEIDDDKVALIKSDNEALLQLGFDWMKSVMFNEKTLKMRERVLNEAIAKAREDMGAT